MIISCLLLLLGEFASVCSGALRCVVKFLVNDLFSFFTRALNAMKFPVRTAFTVSHKFGYEVSIFSLNSRKPLISFFISSLTKLSLSRELFSFHVYVVFLWLLLFVIEDQPYAMVILLDTWDYFGLLVLGEVCSVTNYIVSFGEETMRC